MKEEPSNLLGGDIDDNLQGKYNFDLQKVLTEAWHLTMSGLWSFLASFIAVVAVGMSLLMIGASLAGVEDITLLSANEQVFINLTVTIIMAPFFTALMAMAVNNSIGGKSRINHLFSFLPKALVLAVTAIIVSTIVHVGLVFFIVPGLYLAIATGFAMLLVAEKRLTPFQAVALSIRMVNAYWWDFIRLYLLFALMSVTMIITSGLTLVIIAPLYYHAKGLLYRDLFGITVVSSAQQNHDSGDDTFFNA